MNYITNILVFVAMYVIDRFGRKPLYYVSTIGCTIALVIEFFYFFLQDDVKMNMNDLAWLPVTGIFLFYIFRPIGITTLAHLYMGELFPNNIKGSAVSICLMYGSVISFIVAFGFGMLVEFWGMSYTMLMFGVFCFLGFIFVYFCVPETKGKSLEEIHNHLRRNITKL